MAELSSMSTVEDHEGHHTLTLNDAELNALILGLDALIDEWFDHEKPMEGYDWVGTADSLLTDLNARRDTNA